MFTERTVRYGATEIGHMRFQTNPEGHGLLAQQQAEEAMAAALATFEVCLRQWMSTGSVDDLPKTSQKLT